MNFLKRKETKTIRKEEVLDPMKIEIEGIQGILVKEFELNSRLKEESKMLKVALEETKQIGNEYKLKYEATLLVADEREKRLKKLNQDIVSHEYCIKTLNSEISTLKREKNNYYFKCREYEQSKDKIIANIEHNLYLSYRTETIKTIENLEKQLLDSIIGLDGRTSKKSIIEYIRNNFKKIIDALTLTIEDQHIENVAKKVKENGKTNSVANFK